MIVRKNFQGLMDSNISTSSKQTWCSKLKEALVGSVKISKETIDLELESVQQHKARWRSIYIVFFTVFVLQLNYSMVGSGTWPYLSKLDPTVEKDYLGYVVAAYPLGQLFFSLVVGWWNHKFNSVRSLAIFLIIVFIVTTALHSSLELFNCNRKQWMLAVRFLIGLSSANLVTCRSYVSSATKISERTKAVSLISSAEVLGFTLGAALQAIVAPLGEEGVWIIKNSLRLNLYTAGTWINVILGLINLCLFFPKIFQEHHIAFREAKIDTNATGNQEKIFKINYLATWMLIVAFFVTVFNFAVLETLGSAIIMDEFAWSKQDSVEYFGIMMAIGGVLAMGTFPIITFLAKRCSEVKVLIWCGFFMMLLGKIVIIPFQKNTTVMYDSNLKINFTYICDKLLSGKSVDNYMFGFNITTWQDFNATTIKNLTQNCGDDLLGCPSSQTWCNYTPSLNIPQYVLGYLLTCIGYPIAVTLIQTTYSKILGPRCQGIWMGFITGSSGLSQVLCPLVATYLYENYGILWTFGLNILIIALYLLFLLYFRKTVEFLSLSNKKN